MRNTESLLYAVRLVRMKHWIWWARRRRGHRSITRKPSCVPAPESVTSKRRNAWGMTGLRIADWGAGQ